MVTRSRLKRSGVGARDKSRLVRIAKPNYIDKFRGQTITSGHNHSWEVTEDGKNKLSLGNLTDAGWFWDGDDSDMVGYLVRIARSKITSEFINDVKGKVDFNDVKPVLLKALEKNNGLYEISGDNVVWHFGEGSEIDTKSEAENLKEGNPELTKKEAEQIVDDAFLYHHVDYDEFEKENEKYYKEEMKKIIEESKSFDEFIDKINSEDFRIEWIEMRDEYEHSKYYEGLAKALKEFKKKKKAK